MRDEDELIERLHEISSVLTIQNTKARTVYTEGRTNGWEEALKWVLDKDEAEIQEMLLESESEKEVEDVMEEFLNSER